MNGEASLLRRFQKAAKTPPGRRMRRISARVSRGSNQWNAWAQTTASIEPAGRPVASARAERVQKAGLAPKRAVASARIFSLGSMAVTA